MNNSEKNTSLLIKLLSDAKERESHNEGEEEENFIDLLSSKNLKDLLFQISKHTNEELKSIAGIYYSEILRIKQYDKELLSRLEKEIKNNEVKDEELENFKEDFKNFVKNEKELLEKIFKDNNISELEKESKGFIFGEIIGILTIYINSEYFKNDFKEEIKNKKEIKFEKLIDKINESCYFFSKDKRINVFEKNQKGNYSFNHPSGNKLDMIMIRENNNQENNFDNNNNNNNKINQSNNKNQDNKFDNKLDKYKFSYAMITTSSDSEIEGKSFFKHPIIISKLDNFLNDPKNQKEINTKEKFEKEIGKILNSLGNIKLKNIEEYYKDFISKKENIDKFYKNINGFFIYGSKLILKKNEQHILTNHITTSLFLTAQMLYMPEEIGVKGDILPNLTYFFDKMKSTFFNTSKMQQKNTFFEDNIKTSKEFVEIIKYIENQREEKKSEKEIRKNIEENLSEKFPLINSYINQYYNRKQHEKPGTILNTIQTFFNNNQKIKLLFNTMSVSELFTIEDLEFIKNYTKNRKEDFYIPNIFTKEKGKLEERREKEQERREKEQERREKEQERKEKEQERRKRENIEIIDLVKILENKDINKIKEELIELKEDKEINFNDYKSDIRLIKRLILKNYIYNLKLCDIKELKENEKNYMERLLLLTLTKENVKENMEKLSQISNIEVKKLEEKFNKLKTIYENKFKTPTSLSKDFKLKIENYLFQMLKSNIHKKEIFEKKEISEESFIEFLTKLEKQEIELYEEKELNKRFNKEEVNLEF